MMEFGRFLEYYADAPDIEEPCDRKKNGERETRRKDSNGRDRGPEYKAQKGYVRLFINLGKAEGFYPGEVMQFINQHVSGRGKGGQGQRQEVGHIDLMSHYCFIEVPEYDAKRVIAALDGTTYHGRPVRCNAEGTSKSEGVSSTSRTRRRNDGSRIPKSSRKRNPQSGEFSADDWRSLMSDSNFDFRGEEPDFSEEGWAKRKPRKKRS